MPSNIEIKARVRDREALLRKIEAISEAPGELLRQEDTFFGAPSGRLKLRVLAPNRGELIAYQRADAGGPKQSNYQIAPTSDPESLKSVLAASLGVRGVVRKQRRLFLAGQTRIHLDDVEGLGAFLELEVVLRPDDTPEQGQAIAEALMVRLGVAPEDLVDVAYIDLLVPILGHAPAPEDGGGSMPEDGGGERSAAPVIRDFVREDQDAARRLILAGLEEHWGVLDLSLNPDLNDIASSYAGGVFLVAYHGAVLSGTGALIPEAEGVARIVRMSVDAQRRRAGIGAAILRELIRRARESGFQHIVLETTDTWTDAIGFYLRHGFRMVGLSDGDIHFVKDLTYTHTFTTFDFRLSTFDSQDTPCPKTPTTCPYPQSSNS